MKGCLFGHKWNKWEQYKWNGTVTMTGLLVPEGQRGVAIPCEEIRQKRTCQKCGYMQEEVVKN